MKTVKIIPLENEWYHIKINLGRKLRKKIDLYFKEVKKEDDD